MSQRTEQVASLLVTEVSRIIAREIEPPDGCLITVVHADVTPDLKTATMWVSILPENKTGSAFDVLKRKTGEVQRILNQRMTMKFSPRISWKLDVTTRKFAAVDEAIMADEHRNDT